MLNLDKHIIEFTCPICHFYNYFYFRQARLRDVIICRGCKSNIQLDDHMNECRKVIRRTKRAFQVLENSLKNFTIKL